jgi:hypothetical protein
MANVSATVKVFVDSLSKAEVEEVSVMLQRRIVETARSDSLSYASLLVSTLKVAGRPDLAADISNTMKGV